MDSDDRFYISLTGIIAGTLVALILGSVIVCTHHQRKMAAMGYEETTIVGSAGTVWQKSK